MIWSTGQFIRVIYKIQTYDSRMILNLVILFSVVLQGFSDLSSPNSFFDQLSLDIRQKDLELIDIDKMVMMKKENNEVFITVATYGYREFTVDFYQSSHLQEYRNFFVVVHDVISYQVVIGSSFSISSSILIRFQWHSIINLVMINHWISLLKDPKNSVLLSHSSSLLFDICWLWMWLFSIQILISFYSRIHFIISIQSILVQLSSNKIDQSVLVSSSSNLLLSLLISLIILFKITWRRMMINRVW